MTQRELKRLNRAELLEVILLQIKENKELQEEVSALRAQIDDRNIAIAESGSLAEAVMRLNGVFQAAENAVEQYKENLRCRSECRDAACLPQTDGTAPQAEPHGERADDRTVWDGEARSGGEETEAVDTASDTHRPEDAIPAGADGRMRDLQQADAGRTDEPASDSDDAQDSQEPAKQKKRRFLLFGKTEKGKHGR